MAIKTHSLIFVLFLLVIFGIAFGIIIASLTNNVVQQGSGGLTKKQVSDAIDITISDQGFKSESGSGLLDRKLDPVKLR